MDSNNYRVNFFGKPNIIVAGKERKIRSKRVFALMASVQANAQPLSRQEVQDYLWLRDEEIEESVYAGRLRVLLYSNKDFIEQFLDVGVSEIAFKDKSFDSEFLSDIQVFNALVEWETLDSLKDAVELYKGEFMQGFELKDASFEFTDLLLRQRAYWQHKVTEILDKIVTHLLTGRRKADLSEAMFYVQKSLAINPLRDESQIQLAKLYCKNNQQQQAISQLQNYLNQVQNSLNLSVGKEVLQLLEDLQNQHPQVDTSEYCS